METKTLPKTIDFNIDYLRTGLPQDTYANMVMVKQGRRVANLRIEAWQSSPEKPMRLAIATSCCEPEDAERKHSSCLNLPTIPCSALACLQVKP